MTGVQCRPINFLRCLWVSFSVKCLLPFLYLRFNLSVIFWLGSAFAPVVVSPFLDLFFGSILMTLTNSLCLIIIASRILGCYLLSVGSIKQCALLLYLVTNSVFSVKFARLAGGLAPALG